MPVQRVVTRKTAASSSVSPSVVSRKENKMELQFPKEPNKPSNKLSESVIMLYGEKKIGKTSLAAQFSKRMLHLMCEPQARELPIYQVPCQTYQHVKEWVEKLINEKHDFDSVSVDPLPLFYMMAMEYTGKVHGFEHPHDEKDFGKSWGLVYKDFSAPLMRLLHSKMGIIFHAHETEDEIETREGKTFVIRRPEGMKAVKTFIDANIENVWYYHKRGRERFLQIRGDDFAFACCSFTNRFMTPSGEQVFAVPMGKSAAEGYRNLLLAFDNKQVRTYEELEENDQKTEKKSSVVRRRK